MSRGTKPVPSYCACGSRIDEGEEFCSPGCKTLTEPTADDEDYVRGTGSLADFDPEGDE